MAQPPASPALNRTRFYSFCLCPPPRREGKNTCRASRLAVASFSASHRTRPARRRRRRPEGEGYDCSEGPPGSEGIIQVLGVRLVPTHTLSLSLPPCPPLFSLSKIDCGVSLARSQRPNNLLRLPLVLFSFPARFPSLLRRAVRAERRSGGLRGRCGSGSSG